MTATDKRALSERAIWAKFITPQCAKQADTKNCRFAKKDVGNGR
jgi:hypothetical protein